MKMRAFGLLLVSAFIRNNAVADVLQRGIEIETDDSPGATYISVTRAEDGSLSSLVYETTPALPPFTFDQLRAGAVVLKYDGKLPVISLKLENPFDQTQGGFVDVQFLYDGIGKVYKDFRISIEVQKDVIYRSEPNLNDKMSDDNPFTSVFNYLFFYKRMLMGKEVGISHVTPSLIPSTAD